MRAMRDTRIYLDWAATTPLCTEAAEAMAPFLVPGIANTPLGSNANSLHSEGRAAFQAMEQARSDFASCIGARSDEVYFTSGATESDNWALHGLAHAQIEHRRLRANPVDEPHILIGSIEHEAIAKFAESMKRDGIALDTVAPNPQGFITPDAIEAAMHPNTLLVSVMLANNEIGSIQPIEDIARVAHAHGALMHTDAAQALCKVSIDCHALGVDAASFSAHKVCGPKGVGALYVSKEVAIEPFLYGGGQEHGMRSGTQNVVGIVGFAAATSALCKDPSLLEAETSRQRQLRDKLYAGMLAHERVHANVSCEIGSTDYLCNVASICVDGLESETLVLRLDMLGFAASGASACSSGSLEPSHVLLELGIPRDRALGALRISIGRYTTDDDVQAFLVAFAKVLAWDNPS